MTKTFDQNNKQLFEQIHVTSRHGGKMEGMASTHTASVHAYTPIYTHTEVGSRSRIIM